ncbi:hypothetical protein HOD20_02560 [archaeon]|jgi:hypothetical protein|nr:hypothetical protein [archaeon]MBT4351388.1 hypothetical protein [archaeon]MBT4646873.1 hypothetical protein [archaeon]MBT6822118.1 hypothetical protein [archaeon]MBT7392607.1 hypothetical protein [archaeon]
MTDKVPVKEAIGYFLEDILSVSEDKPYKFSFGLIEQEPIDGKVQKYEAPVLYESSEKQGLVNLIDGARRDNSGENMKYFLFDLYESSRSENKARKIGEIKVSYQISGMQIIYNGKQLDNEREEKNICFGLNIDYNRFEPTTYGFIINNLKFSGEGHESPEKQIKVIRETIKMLYGALPTK